jgi:hypothetical protein
MRRSVVDRSCAVSYLRRPGMLAQNDQDLKVVTDRANSAVS